MNKVNLGAKLPSYYIARNLRLNSPLPINMTLTLTNVCNSRCLTCRKYEMKSNNELTVEEWAKIFTHLPMFWATISGGEPFLYDDITEVYWHLISLSHPSTVNIPTNGLLGNRVVHKVWEMANMDKKTQLIINISLDHWIPCLNDEIRGVKGYYQKATKTLMDLQKLDCENLTVGIHTVISKYNVKNIGSISENLSKLLLNKSHYITEIAEHREELGTMGLDITPTPKDYRTAIKSLNHDKSLIQSLRNVYYKRVASSMEGNINYVPCYAGYLSGQIASNGGVWHCCLQAKSIGNLRDYDYDMRKLWNNYESQRLRENNRRCVCPMANAGYTNSILHLPTMVKVARGLI